MLRSLPHELGRLFQLQVLGLAGNPLCQEVMKLYSEPNGTHRLLMYLLDSLQGKIIYSISYNIHCESVIFNLYYYKSYPVIFQRFTGIISGFISCVQHFAWLLQITKYVCSSHCFIYFYNVGNSPGKTISAISLN